MLSVLGHAELFEPVGDLLPLTSLRETRRRRCRAVRTRFGRQLTNLVTPTNLSYGSIRRYCGRQLILSQMHMAMIAKWLPSRITQSRTLWERLMSINPVTTRAIAAAWYQPSRSPINAIAWTAAKAGVRVSDAAVSTGPFRVSEML